MDLARPRADLSPVTRINSVPLADLIIKQITLDIHFGMKWKKLLYAFALSALLVSFCRYAESKKVIIHVPYRVKNVKHVHTVYKIIPHYHDEEEEEEEKKEEEIEEDDRYDSY